MKLVERFGGSALGATGFRSSVGHARLVFLFFLLLLLRSLSSQRRSAPVQPHTIFRKKSIGPPMFRGIVPSEALAQRIPAAYKGAAAEPRRFPPTKKPTQGRLASNLTPSLPPSPNPKKNTLPPLKQAKHTLKRTHTHTHTLSNTHRHKHTRTHPHTFLSNDKRQTSHLPTCRLSLGVFSRTPGAPGTPGTPWRTTAVAGTGCLRCWRRTSLNPRSWRRLRGVREPPPPQICVEGCELRGTWWSWRLPAIRFLSFLDPFGV